MKTSHSVALLAIFCCVGTASASTVVGSGPGYVIRISDGDRVAVLEIETAEYEEWADGLVDTSGVRSMTGRLYDHFHDDFDFIVFSSNETSVRPGVYFGRHFAAQNDTAGIGKSLFDVSDLYGSLGALQSAVHLPSISGLRGGPSLHEFVHRWGVSLPDISGSSHWGFAGTGGQLGGFEPGTLMDLGGGLYDADGPRGTSFGTVANGGNGLDYGALELYLMGLIDVAEFKVLHGGGGDIQVPVNPVFTNSAEGQFTADRIDTVNIDDIVAAEGIRLPGQVFFKTLFVLLVDGAEPADEIEIDDFDARAELFGLDGSDNSTLFNFWEATGGRASMEVGDLSLSLVPEPGRDALAPAALAVLAALAHRRGKG